MDNYVKRLTSLRTQIASATAFAAPANSAAMGALPAGWVETGLVALEIEAASAVDLTAAVLVGYDPKTESIRSIMDITQGETISLTATLGWERPIVMLAGFTHLDLVGTLSGAVNVTVAVTPIEQRS